MIVEFHSCTAQQRGMLDLLSRILLRPQRLDDSVGYLEANRIIAGLSEEYMAAVGYGGPKVSGKS